MNQHDVFGRFARTFWANLRRRDGWLGSLAVGAGTLVAFHVLGLVTWDVAIEATIGAALEYGGFLVLWGTGSWLPRWRQPQ